MQILCVPFQTRFFFNTDEDISLFIVSTSFVIAPISSFVARFFPFSVK
jgi:hypothetical protein